MSIRPVDLQVLLPKAQEAHQTHNNTQNQVTQQQVFSEQLQRQVRQDGETVTNTKQSENQNVDKDGSNKNAYEDSRKKGKKKGDPLKQAAAAHSQDRSMIDISI